MTEWREFKIKDIADVVGGGTPSTAINEYWNGDIPWLTPKDLTGYIRNFISHGERFIAKKGLENSSARLLPKGTVLLTSRAPIGYVAIAENEICTNQGFKSLVPNPDKAHNLFLLYWIKSNVEYLQSIGTGTTFQEISGSVLKDVDIILPPLPEQKAIAEVLSSLDDKIDLLTRQNKTLEDIAQAYFRKWFIEEARDEWITGRLGDLCEVITKGTTPTTIKKNFVNNGINFLKVESISDSGAFLEDKFMHIDEETHNLLKRSQLKENDVLCSIAGTIGRIARVSKEILPANVNQALAIIRAKKYFRFIYYLLKSDIFQNEIHSRIVESVQANLSLSEISSIEIAIPEELINKFELFVAPIDDKVQNNKNQIRILSKLRDTLLPKLISGEIRIKM